jgi:hypothetical protein
MNRSHAAVHAWRSGRCPDDANSYACGGSIEGATEPVVSVSDQDLRPFAKRCRISKLLGRPLFVGSARRGKVNDVLGVYVDNEEGKEAPKPDIANGDEVARPRAVISKKHSPSLAVRGATWTRPNHVFLNGALGKVNAEFEQFTSNSLRSPKEILCRHTSNERDHVACDAWYGRL